MLKTLGLAFCSILLASCSSGGGGSDEPDGPELDAQDGFMAEVMCEEFVKERLKAPATAEFSNQQHREIKDQRWDVTGIVDSENGFGALIRGSYRCDIRYLGDDNWRAKTVAVD